MWLHPPQLIEHRLSKLLTDRRSLGKQRVSLGGHNIPTDVITRRYDAGLQNFFQLYTPICDYWTLYDNSNIPGEKIAYGWKDERLSIVDEEKYYRLYNTYAKAESHE
jgi:predicted ABC-type ATPase